MNRIRVWYGRQGNVQKSEIPQNNPWLTELITDILGGRAKHEHATYFLPSLHAMSTAWRSLTDLQFLHFLPSWKYERFISN